MSADRNQPGSGFSGGNTRGRTRISLAPDIAVGLVALFLGSALFLYLHEQWFGSWMSMIGDPPLANPAYRPIMSFFFAAQSAASGAVIGLISGIGRARPLKHPAMRLLLGPVAFSLITVSYCITPLISGGFPTELQGLVEAFIPVSLVCFSITLVIGQTSLWLTSHFIRHGSDSQ